MINRFHSNNLSKGSPDPAGVFKTALLAFSRLKERKRDEKHPDVPKIQDMQDSLNQRTRKSGCMCKRERERERGRSERERESMVTSYILRI